MLSRLTIDDYSDREFLLVVMDSYDDDGMADSHSVADRLNMESCRSVSCRLSWLVRWGVVEREQLHDENGNPRFHRDGRVRYGQRWRVTKAGEQLASGELRKTDQSALEKLKDDQMLHLTRWLSDRTGKNAFAAKMVQREWRNASARYGYRVR